jgi:hypothetical protein
MDQQVLIRVDDFKRYNASEEFNDVNIAVFLKSLAWMQQGEYHHRRDFGFQRRLLGQNKPRVYLVSVYWSACLFATITNEFASAGLERMMNSYINYPLAPDWVDQGGLNLYSNIRGDGARRTRRQYRLTEDITNPEVYGCVVFPFNIFQFHWLTVVVDNKKRAIYLYDFLFATGHKARRASATRRLHDRFLDIVMEFLNSDRDRRRRRNNGVGHAPVQWSKAIVITSQLQRDGVNCGVLVCLVAWLTAWWERPPTEEELKEIDYGEEEMATMRRWMAYSALTDRIWLPPVAENMFDAYKNYYERVTGTIWRHRSEQEVIDLS